jgi:D-xylono/L-arabinono-1,4-lactonase
MKYDIEPLANAHCNTGENPLWDKEKRLIYWEDIPNGRLFRLNVDTREWEKFYEGEVVGGFTLQDDGRLLLFGVNRFGILGDDGSVQTLAQDLFPQTGRFNDVMADPFGGVLAGTMGKDNPGGGRTLNGGLFKVTPDGGIKQLWDGTGCSNGMGYSPDRKTFYWTDTTHKTIFAFDHDPATGELENRRAFIVTPPDGGSPDGMAVDSNGEIWSARWGGWGIFHYDLAGQLIEKIEMPVERVSSLIFADDDLQTLYVTTAGGSDDSDTADGTLYRVRVDVKGQEEYRSRVGI